MPGYDANKDYYDILRVHQDASAEEINKTYRQQARERHPDLGGSEEDMKALNEAYEVLSDQVSRRAYDTERGIPPVSKMVYQHNRRSAETSTSSANFDTQQAGDLFGLMVGMFICLGLGSALLLLVELQWVFFLWPLRIIAWGIIFIGLMLAHAAFRHKFYKLMMPTPQSSRGWLIVGEAIFWLGLVTSVLLLYLTLQAISK
ncbi:MAG: J domain-containing protein [Acidobacteriota bacterium]